jgi:murein DD-endopeptidase MepM/ murein hydrolase activator NlpD
MILNILIVSKYNWKSRKAKHEAIKKLMLLSPDIEDVIFTVEKRDVGKPETYVDEKGKTRIRESWFEENISKMAKAQGFTHAGFQFSDADGKKWGIASGHRGLNFNDGDFFGEFWVKSNENSKRIYSDGMVRDMYETVVPHEVGHEITREGLTTMEMHDYDFQLKINRIEVFYATLRIKKESLIFTLWQRIFNLTGIKKLIEQPMLPIKDFEKVSQHFLNPDPMYKSGVHNGTDWAVPVGTPVFAPLDGYISTVFKNHTELGNACYFHFKFQGKQYVFRLLHLKEVPKVRTILKGEIFCFTGNTGKTKGKGHLHGDLWRGNVVNTSLIKSKKGVMENLIDPYKFFKGII